MASANIAVINRNSVLERVIFLNERKKTKMNQENVRVEQMLQLIEPLTPIEKIRLVTKVISDLETPLKMAINTKSPLQSVYGCCADLAPVPSAEEIDQMRQEVFADFGQDKDLSSEEAL